MASTQGIPGSVSAALTSTVIGAVIVGLSLANGGFEPVAVGAATAFVWLVFLGALLSGRVRIAEIRPAAGLASILLAALVAFSAFSLTWSSDDGAGFVDTVRFAGYLGVFLLAALTLRPPTAAAALLGVAVGGGVVSLIALGSRLLGFGGDAELASVLGTAAGRLSYPLGYWNALAALGALSVPALLHFAAGATTRSARSLASAVIPAVLLAIFMTSSRGGLLAAAVGGSVAIGLAVERRRALATFFCGIAAAVPAVVAAELGTGILNGPGTAIGRAELAVIAALLAGVAFAAFAGPPISDRLGAIREPRVRLRYFVGAAVAVVGVLVALAGPSTLIGNFQTTEVAADQKGGGLIASTSGSGRAQFWGTALEAFGTDPVKGIGAGGYEPFWNQRGSLVTATQNAHSEPLEVLAELGLVGFAAFAGFLAAIFVAGARRARAPTDSLVGVTLGVLFAGLIGVSIDWTWEMPAVIFPVLVAAALLAGPALEAPAVSPAPRRWPHLRAAPSSGMAPGPVAAAAAAAIAIALAAVWAGGVLTVSSSSLDDSNSALAEGRLADAADAARVAASVEPWDSEPWLQLAEVEQSADNYEAASRAAEAAIERSPGDFMPWLLAATLQMQQGHLDASVDYALRAAVLAPLVLQRAVSGAQVGEPGS